MVPTERRCFASAFLPGEGGEDAPFEEGGEVAGGDGGDGGVGRAEAGGALGAGRVGRLGVGAVQFASREAERRERLVRAGIRAPADAHVVEERARDGDFPGRVEGLVRRVEVGGDGAPDGGSVGDAALADGAADAGADVADEERNPPEKQASIYICLFFALQVRITLCTSL